MFSFKIDLLTGFLIGAGLVTLVVLGDGEASSEQITQQRAQHTVHHPN